MGEKMLATRFGLVVRQLRLDKGLSQEGLADLCGLHRTYIGTIERGEKNVTIETANKLAKALGVKLSHLFTLLEEAGTNSESNHDRCL